MSVAVTWASFSSCESLLGLSCRANETLDQLLSWNKSILLAIAGFGPYDNFLGLFEQERGLAIKLCKYNVSSVDEATVKRLC